jgi:glutathione-independent formaldehyde dehydrogenase
MGWRSSPLRHDAYADFNLMKFPDRDQALARIRDLTMLTDILPTGFHAAVRAEVGVGSTVYIAGCGPVGLAAAASARILGAAVVMIGDLNKDRLAHAKKVGFEAIDLNAHDRLGELVAAVIGEPVVDSFIDAVGFEARGHGGAEQPAIVLNQAMEVTRYAGSIGIPGLYVTKDPGSHDKQAARKAHYRSISVLAGRNRIPSLPAGRRSCGTIVNSCRRSCTIASQSRTSLMRK